ncbi:MAG: hypothetical protein J6K48_01585 [Lachnospiraceae bacterium]|nr:hypothetical protein [Lachnospiraceae bacterium]
MKKASKGTLTIRAVVAAYLLYLAYGLTQDYAASGNQTVTVIGIVVFVLSGGVILFTSLRSLARGEYEDGRESDEPSEEEAGADTGQCTEENTKNGE